MNQIKLLFKNFFQSRSLSFILTLVLLLSVNGCSALFGEEIGRVHALQEGQDFDAELNEVVLDLKKGDEIGIWSEMDMHYEGQVGIEIALGIWVDESILQEISFDPRDKNPSLMEVKTSLGNTTDWSFSGKHGTVKIEQDGSYLFRAVLKTSGGSNLKFDVADVVLKK